MLQLNPILPEDEFNLLWKINPKFDTAEQNHEKTYALLASRLSYPETTPDGRVTDFVLIYERYKQYVHTKALKHEGIEERYIGKADKLKCLFDYLWDKLYMSEEKMPENATHYYFWGDASKDDIVEQYERFKRICTRKEKKQ